MASASTASSELLPNNYTTPTTASSPLSKNNQTVSPSSTTFQFPAYTSFPPFYTLQPNTTTRTHQLQLWSALLLSYTAHHHLFRLSLTTPPTDLFTSPTPPHRALSAPSIRTLLTHMSTPAGGSTIEFLPPASKGEQSNAVWVWWKSASEWADEVYGWVDETGQKGAVLTVYELREGEGRAWAGMEEGMLRRVLGVLVKRGRAQVFGGAGEGGEGVKFF